MENLIKKHIRFNDIWLMIYFFIHVIYIVLCIFFPVPKENEKSVLDVVMRTSAAVLIGYFLSKSFVSNKSPITADEGKRIRIRVQSDVIGAIGLFCLCVFGIVRFISSIVMPYYIMSQLRDFYLASTAFLMGTGKVNCQTKYNTQAKKILMDCLLIELLTGLVKSAYLHYGIANKVSVTIQSEVSTKK